VRWGRAAFGVLCCVLTTTGARAFGWPSQGQAVSEALGSQDAAERAAAAARLVHLPAASARPLIELSLEDEDDAVRLAGARAAVVQGQRGLGDQVAPWLKDAAAPVRAAALRVLALDLDARHASAVARATLDADEGVRLLAMRCLGRARMGLTREVTPALAAGLDDASALVRAEAAMGLGRVGDLGGVSPLLARASDAEESVRRAVVVALGALGDRKATTTLSFALSDRSSAVATLAARSLGELRDPSAQSSLERAFLEPGWGPPQIAAGEALRDLDDRRGWDVLVARLSEQEAAPALRSLFSELSPSAKDSVAACLKDSGGLALIECARIAARAGIDQGALLDRVRRGGLSTVKIFQATAPTDDVELLVLAVERLTRGSLAERRAALDLLEKSAPLPRETGRLLGEALGVPGLSASEVSRLLLLLDPQDLGLATLEQFARASDPTTRASARALLTLREGERGSLLGPFLATPLEAHVYGELLARGMDRRWAARLLAELGERGVPLSAPMLRALEGAPSDLPQASVAQLLSLVRAEQGTRRERLLYVLGAQGSSDLAAWFLRAEVQDRRSLSSLFPRVPALAKLASGALVDPDPWVRTHAAQGARASDLDQLLRLTATTEPAYVRTAALLGLARLEPVKAASALRACDLLHVPELGVRVGALLLVDRAALDCPGTPLEDIVLGQREPILRELAARALERRDPGHRALRSCRAYDPEPTVAAACGASRKRAGEAVVRRLEFVEIVPPWLDAAAPSCPYALFDGAGQLFVGLTDRSGRAPVLDAQVARVLDPRIAL